ncbi:Tn3 family transposase [Mesorhizobium sp. YR577]|uniref:Tn3 family transposase n=1 Tax=Mesorhizobium sp. YR577 TaxID=1884373 RepID=UPI0008EC0BB0|nr:Tn3 family transposase [Mesorhizobium sp. YR577]SFU23071.1 Tn3 transposase DDE domain-containing protein [Mesorhizobium sp. YR577]
MLHVHRRFIHAPALREACARVANATLAIRNAAVWGDAGTACASDSTKFGAWDRNLMTEWHARYGGRGVMKNIFRSFAREPSFRECKRKLPIYFPFSIHSR